MNSTEKMSNFISARRCEVCGNRIEDVEETSCGLILKCGLCARIYRFYWDILNKC
jgi:hypothetical protein